MPTIAFVSPKGGVGKTTSSFLFALAISKIYPVTVIDADPKHTGVRRQVTPPPDVPRHSANGESRARAASPVRAAR
jgi:Mrp family chromosome partitioning ATPase